LRLTAFWKDPTAAGQFFAFLAAMPRLYSCSAVGTALG